MEKRSISERSLLSPTRWSPDAFAWPRALVALVIILVAFGAGALLGSSTAVRLGVTRHDVLVEHLSWGILVAQLINYVFLVPAVLLLLPWLARRSLRDLGIRSLDARSFGGALLGAIAMYAVTLAIANVQYGFTHEKPEQAATALFTSAHDPLLSFAFAALAVVIAPFVEELTFRGFLFNALLRYAPVWVAATISGAIFGISHGSPSAFLPLAGSGIVLAYVYYLTGSLPASMLTHGLFNAINITLIAIGKTA